MHKIAVAYGDGIGPEIMKATLLVLKEAGANLDLHEIEIGEKVYLKGIQTGIDPSAWDVLNNTKAFLKAPITTPQGGGYKSVNVTIRSTLGLYANIRPCATYFPFITTKYPQMDLIIIRENEEDLYTGIEYRQTPNTMVAHKTISRQGCEKIVRYGFEYAKQHNRKKVTCFIKDNIMKFTDGLFHQVFDEIGKEYPDFVKESFIVDIGAAKLATRPELFDVLILPNLYGDILSDVTAEMSGSIGIAPSANIGSLGAMFEAIHGSAPRRANQNSANPSGLLLASIMMMAHLGEIATASSIHKAWLTTLEEGIHTYDIFTKENSKSCVGTLEFAQAVVKNLGKSPKKLIPAIYKKSDEISHYKTSTPTEPKRELVGVDLFIYLKESPSLFQKTLQSIHSTPFTLKMITNRGATIWPNGHEQTFCTEQWRCRFIGNRIQLKDITALMDQITTHGLDLFKTENLYTFDGIPGYSSAE
jgi:isocitrate dehydrogenase